MLEQMRKHMGWIMWVILVLIIVSFLFFGIYPAGDSGNMVASINGDVVSYEEWNRTYQTMAENYRQIFRDQFNESFSKVLRRQALQDLIEGRLLGQEAERMGIRISDEEVRASILAIPAFSPEGTFDQRVYEFYLNRVNLSPARFEAGQRESLRRQRIVAMVEDSVAVTDAEVMEAIASQPKPKGVSAEAHEENVRRQLVMKKRQDALDAYVAVLRQKAEIKIGPRFESL